MGDYMELTPEEIKMLERFEQSKTLTANLITNNQNIFIQASSNAWVAIISLSGILATGFSMVCTMNSKQDISMWTISEFFLLTVGVCGFLIWNYIALRETYKTDITMLMRCLDLKTIPSEEEQKEHSDNQTKTQDNIIFRERFVYFGLVLQIVVLFSVIAIYR